MKRKVKAIVETERKGLFGNTKKVQEYKTVKVDQKTYKRIMREKRKHPFSSEEMMLYDMLDD